MRFSEVRKLADKAMLYEEELDVIVALLEKMLEQYEVEQPNMGSVVLYGQEKGCEAKRILQLSLEGGAYDASEFKAQNYQNRTSEDLVEGAVWRAMLWPSNPAYGIHPKALNFGELPTGIYEDGLECVLVLNTTLGRFLAGVALAEKKKIPNEPEPVLLNCEFSVERTLVGLATALAKMCPEDVALRRSLRKILADAVTATHATHGLVAGLLEGDSLPEIKAWKAWHAQAANSEEGLAVYFG